MKSLGKNILVIRSAARVFNPTLASLKQEFPGSKITVLAPESVREALLQDPLVDEVLPLKNNGRMGIFNYGLKNIGGLRACKFDLAVSLYNVEEGLGYSNVDLLAWMSNAGRVRGYNCKGSFIDLSPAAIFKKKLREGVSGIWVGFNFLATVVLFFLITLGLLGEWCFRKVFQRRGKNQQSVNDHAKTQSR